jgi:hypothetical protein
MCVLAVGGANAARFYASEHWVYFVAVGFVIPIAATIEFLRAHRRGPEAGQTADRLIPYVALSLVTGLI